MIAVAVITVSDSVSAGTREDRSGPALIKRLGELGHFVIVTRVVTDDRPQFAALLKELCAEGTVSGIFTTGGTGIALRDVTPEATRDVIEREIPGLGELMCGRAEIGADGAPFPRALGGSCGRTLIVNFPVSPRGAVESLDAIVDLVPHIVDLLNGNTEHK